MNFALPKVFTPDDPPVSLNVQTDPLQIHNNAAVRMLVPAAVLTNGILPYPPSDSCRGFHQWAHALGGIDRDRTLVKVIAQGNTDAAVVITGMTIKIVSQDKSTDSVPILCSSAGEAQIRRIDFDLDSSDIPARYLGDDGTEKPFGFDLKHGETEIFNIEAHTRSTGVKAWELVMHVTVKGKEKLIRITDHGSLFRTAGGPVVVPEHNWDWSQLRWSVLPKP